MVWRKCKVRATYWANGSFHWTREFSEDAISLASTTCDVNMWSLLVVGGTQERPDSEASGVRERRACDTSRWNMLALYQCAVGVFAPALEVRHYAACIYLLTVHARQFHYAACPSCELIFSCVPDIAKGDVDPGKLAKEGGMTVSRPRRS